jgi:hypothetical protein
VPALLIFCSLYILQGMAIIEPNALGSMVYQAGHPFEDYGQTTYHWQQPLWLLWAYVAGATTPKAYILWCALLAILAGAGAIYGAWRCWGRQWGMLVLVSPMIYTLTTWVGLEDPLVVFCTMLALWSSNPFLFALVGLVGMMTHPVAVIAPAMVIWLRCRNTGSDELPEGALIWWILGLVIGGVCLLSVVPDEMLAGGRWAMITQRSLWEWVTLSILQAPLALYSMAFALWVPLGWAVYRYWIESPRFYTAFVVCLALSALLTTFTLDTSRVLALLTWAPILLALRRAWVIAAAPAGWDHGYLACLVWTGWLGIWAPRLGIWEGVVRTVPFLEWLR